MEESLAQDVLLDHFKTPRRKGALPGATLAKVGVNPACGDRVQLTGALVDGRWALMAEGAGCVVSQASASMLAEALGGKADMEARALARAVALWLGGRGPAPDFSAALEDLEALAGVRRHPARVKCAGLAWNLFLEGVENAAHGG